MSVSRAAMMQLVLSREEEAAGGSCVWWAGLAGRPPHVEASSSVLSSLDLLPSFVFSSSFSSSATVVLFPVRVSFNDIQLK